MLGKPGGPQTPMKETEREGKEVVGSSWTRVLALGFSRQSLIREPTALRIGAPLQGWVSILRSGSVRSLGLGTQQERPGTP